MPQWAISSNQTTIQNKEQDKSINLIFDSHCKVTALGHCPSMCCALIGNQGNCYDLQYDFAF